MVARRARSYYLCCALLMSPFIGTIFERSGALDSAVNPPTIPRSWLPTLHRLPMESFLFGRSSCGVRVDLQRATDQVNIDQTQTS